MKQLFFFFAVISFLSSCTVIKINNSFNTTVSCHYAENSCVDNEGTEIIVKGYSCDYQEFFDSKFNENVLTNKGYKMIVDHDIIVFLHPKHHQY